MPLFRHPLTALSEADLQALIENRVPESRTLDYKRDAVGRSDGDKKEFLADVSSFANTAGGHLVFGMDETGGLPTALPGLAGLDADAEIRRLDELIRDGLEPTILGIELRAVPLASGAVVVVIRIPKSRNPPHQVTYQKTFRFYGRGAAGKHPLDVTALREMFMPSAEAEEPSRSARFQATQPTHAPSSFLKRGEPVVEIDFGRGQRIADERASVLADGPQLFLRVMPTIAVPPLTGPACYKALQAVDAGLLLPLNTRYRDGYWAGRNVHGAVSIVREHWHDGEEALHTVSLTQILKTGEIWGIDTGLLRYDKHDRARFGDNFSGYFPTGAVQDLFVSGMNRYLHAAKTALKLPLPLTFIAGATGVAGFRASISSYGLGGRCVEPNIVFEGQIDRYDQPAEEILSSFFKHLWAECGIGAPL